MNVLGLIVGAVIGGFGSTMLCQNYTATGATTPLCANANGSIPTSLIVGAVVGGVIGAIL